MDERIIKYFQGDLTKNEIQKLFADIEINSSLRKDFIDCRNLSSIINLAPQQGDTMKGAEGYRQFRKSLKIKAIKRFSLKAASYAAAITCTIVASYFVAEKNVSRNIEECLTSQTNTLYVPAGQRASIKLQDGTTVWLNAQSTLEYPACFTTDERKVSLNGEAYFEVAKDASRPVIVNADDVKIKVLGTKFNVFNYPDSPAIKTSLIEGSVSISYSGSNILIRPGEECVAQGGKMNINEFNVQETLSWRDGIYIFNDICLSEIVEKLELYYDVKIEIENPALESERYTCKFRLRDGIETILETISGINHFKIIIDKENNRITIK